MSSLPPGVTDEMCEGGPERSCANCGHSEEFHLDEGLSPCDYAIKKSKGYVACDCTCYEEGEFEPEVLDDE